MKYKEQAVLDDDRDDDYEHSSKKRTDKQINDDTTERKPHPRAGFAPFGRFSG
jgi:hypothetical protein